MKEQDLYKALSGKDEVPGAFHEAMKRTLDALPTTISKSIRPYRAIRRTAAALLAAALLACGTLTALAAGDNDQAYDLLFSFWPEAAQKLKPVRLDSEDQGLRLEVVSANVEGGEAEILVAFQDLTADRLDDSVDFFDTESLNLPYDGWATCSQVAYDAETKTAYFLIRTGTNNGEAIEGDKLTFSVGGFLSGKQKTTETLATGGQLAVLDAYGSARDAVEGEMPDSLPDEAIAPFDPVEGIRVEAMGLLDGRLHVRYRGLDNRYTDNHGLLYLVDRAGDCVYPERTGYLNTSGADQVLEAEFDVPAGTLTNYTLMGDFVTARPMTEGHWQVTFPIEDREEQTP